jgi:creatinine amidohydrolase
MARRIGFRNIHAIIHHHTENFAAEMPSDLISKLAARQAIFASLEERAKAGGAARRWWIIMLSNPQETMLSIGSRSTR